LHKTDGTVVNQSGPDCEAEYLGDRAVSDCTLPSGKKSHVVMNLENVTSTTYEAVVLENNLVPSAVGSRARTLYRIDGGKLVLTVYPPKSPNSNTFKIESIYVLVKQ